MSRPFKYLRLTKGKHFRRLNSKILNKIYKVQSAIADITWKLIKLIYISITFWNWMMYSCKIETTLKEKDWFDAKVRKKQKRYYQHNILYSSCIIIHMCCNVKPFVTQQHQYILRLLDFGGHLNFVVGSMELLTWFFIHFHK